jgi:hypothetical protein
MQQGRAARCIEIISARTQPHRGESLLQALSNGALDVSQYAAVSAHIDAYSWHFEDCYIQFDAATIDRAAWEPDVATLPYLIALPVFRAQWRIVRLLSNGPYRDYVDSLMREVPVAKPDNFRSRWNALLAEELAESI